MEQQQPVLFSKKVRQAAQPPGGYPFQISADDLDKNFTFCAKQFDENDFEVAPSSGAGGHPTHKIRLKGSQSRSRILLQREDDAPNFVIDIDCADLKDTPNPKMELVEYYVVVNGVLKKSQFLATSQPYDP